MSAPTAGAATRGSPSGGEIELLGGYAGDAVWHGGVAWVAWVACDDAEPALLTAVDRHWRLRPGITVNTWRERTARATFAISVAAVADGRLLAGRELGRSRYTIEGPALAPLPDRSAPAVMWTERRARGSALLATVDGSTVEVVAEAPAAILSPRIAADAAGRTWAAWQQWAAAGRTGIARPQIVAASRDRNAPPGTARAWSVPELVSAPGQSAWAPALASDPDGGLWCAWDAWDGGAYHIHLRYRPPTGGWCEPVQLSPPAPNYYHLAPDVAAAEGHAWVVWSRTPRWGVHNYRFNHTRSLHCAVVTVCDDGSLAAAPAPGQPVLSESDRLPVASIPFLHSMEEEFVNPLDPRVRLGAEGPVVFFRQFRSAEFKDFGWSIHAVRHTGQDWATPVRVSAYEGFPDTAYGIAAADRVGEWLLAYHAAEFPMDAESHPVRQLRRHRLIVERVSLPETTAGDPPGLRTVPAARLSMVPGAARPLQLHGQGGDHRRERRLSMVPGAARPLQPPRAKVADLPKSPERVTVCGRTYQLLYGDLHRHSAYSKCMAANDGDPLDHWRWMRDVAELDFYAITEHLEAMSYPEWRRIEDLTEALAADGQTLALCGFEVITPPGHTNFLYAGRSVGHDLRIACLSARDAGLRAIWSQLDAWLSPDKVVAIRHHQGHQGDVAVTYAPQYEPVVEIVQTRGEYPHWVQSLWRQGFRVGVIGGSDHSRGAPFAYALTGLWLPENEWSRQAVIASVRDRRTFATNGVRLSLFLWAEGPDGAPAAIMGEAAAVSTAPRLIVEATGTRALDTVAIYRNDRLIHAQTLGELRARVSYVDRDAPPGDHAYWVRVTQRREFNGVRPPYGVAYSSPIWLTVNEGESGKEVKWPRRRAQWDGIARR